MHCICNEIAFVDHLGLRKHINKLCVLKPTIYEVSTKTIVKIVNYPGIESWFVLIKGSKIIQNGLFISAKNSNNSFTAGLLEFQTLLHDFIDVFEPPGLLSLLHISHQIYCMDETVLVPRHRQYRMSPAEQAENRRQIYEMLAKDWIHPFCSPYGAPILFCAKKTG